MVTTHSKVARWHNDLLPNIVDRIARDAPDTAYGLWPIFSASYEEGYQTFTSSQFAFNGFADCSHEDQLCGLFFSSPRSSAATHQALLETLKSDTLITTSPVPPPALTILEAVRPRKLTMPGINQLIGQSYEHYNCEKPYDKNGHEPAMATHTSGSTGLPNPIIWTYEAIARHHNGTVTAPPEGVRSLDHFLRGKRVLTTMPPFHIFWGVPFGSTPVAPVTAAILTAQGVVYALKQTPADIAVLVPSIVAELAEDPVSLNYVASRIELLVYLGGDLPQAIRDRVVAKLPLRCQYSCFEIGFAHQLWPTELGPQDWRYIRFHPCSGATFEETVDGTYELVFRKQKSLLTTQPVWSILGQQELDEYRTRDLFDPHPTVGDAWCWRAQKDDIIVFLNCQKTNPVAMEQSVVAANTELTDAIVVGAQRFQAALQVEPANTVSITNTADEAALIERIWPSIEKANTYASAHARVENSMILIADPNRPLILAQYATEIDNLYSNADAEVDEDIEVYSSQDTTIAQQQIRDIVLKTTGWHDVENSAGFFESGMDSLQALSIIRALRRGLGASHLALSTLYKNPSIELLPMALLTKKDNESDSDQIQPLLSTYSKLLHQIEPRIPGTTGDADTSINTADVVLTGSTGILGTHILRALLDRQDIGHTFCLNRRSDGGRAIQATRFQAAGLAVELLQDRVTFLQSGLAQPLLILDKDTYERLRSRVSVIIHNAWPVNFNMNLLAFRPQLAGLVNLFALSNAAAATVTFLFVSSVGVVINGGPGPAPEALVALEQQLHRGGSNGYFMSKLIAEHLCDYAARHLASPVLVARVGVWNPAEWLPSLVISSRYVGCVPDSLGMRLCNVDWAPVDTVADVIVDLVTHTKEADEATKDDGVFNIRNPTLVRWEDVLPAIKEGIEVGLGRTVDVVSPETWLARLGKRVEAITVGNDGFDTAVAASPAIKLVDFYRNSLWNVDHVSSSSETTPHVSMAIEKNLDASQTLRNLSPITPRWMRKWVDEWLTFSTEMGSD
ncbi:putative NRPS-like enzyme [Xylariaceae sp. FL1272]|nr:putative NRPS-like enzyme [Xylariaceae sp. FL1272]